ncbi:MAG: F0F1 ATP synthase subunit B [Anaerovoracaceae bacterium]|jgi:F-type H+-transporting ATPase subunit b
METVQPLFQLNWNLLFSVITFVVLFFILRHFFFEKVHKMMVDREEEVRTQIEDAEDKEEEAQKKLKEYREKLDSAEAEGREIVKKARIEAREQAEGIIADADAEAAKTLENARKEIEREKFDARKKLSDEVGDLAVRAAGRIMQKELSPEDQAEIIDEVIKEGEKGEWN